MIDAMMVIMFMIMERMMMIMMLMIMMIVMMMFMIVMMTLPQRRSGVQIYIIAWNLFALESKNVIQKRKNIINITIIIILLIIMTTINIIHSLSLSQSDLQ